MPNPNLEKNTILATYRIVTPMFCGGAEQQAEFRLASFKGVLRFWWRALMWGQLQSLAKLLEAEADLFGSSDEGQSSFLMRLTQPPIGHVIDKTSQLKDGNELVGEGAKYLGYGVMEAFDRRDRDTGQIKSRAAQLNRSCLSAPDSFGLALRFVPGSSDTQRTSETQRKQVVQAMKFAGLLGGMGSKSRKGYGSLTLTSLSLSEVDSWSAAKSLDEFLLATQSLLGEARGSIQQDVLPKPDATPLTAFTAGIRIIAIEGRKEESALKLLDRIGREMVRFRSWGRSQRGEPPKVLNCVTSEKNFRPDHDLMRVRPVPAELHGTYPRRIAFGLPHNYGPRPVDHVGPADATLNRRASPLLIHIHQAEGSPPLGVLTFLPSMFLPEKRNSISVGGNTVPLQTEDFWKPVTDFIDRLLDPLGRSEEFTKEDRVKEVARG